MPKLTELDLVRECCHRAAEILLKNWRTMPRKDPDYCKIAMAFDAEKEGDTDLLSIHIPWKRLETITLPELCDALFAAVTKPLQSEGTVQMAPPSGSVH